MEYTEKQLKEFQEEIKKLSTAEQKALFYDAIKKEADDLTNVEARMILSKANYLSDDEKYRFRFLLVEENVTPEEKIRWLRLYPLRTNFGNQVASSFFYKFFPKRVDVV